MYVHNLQIFRICRLIPRQLTLICKNLATIHFPNFCKNYKYIACQNSRFWFLH